ncbi:hypothetical protein LguiA_025509 [Lonicera macranthoides]
MINTVQNQVNNSTPINVEATNNVPCNEYIEKGLSTSQNSVQNLQVKDGMPKDLQPFSTTQGPTCPTTCSPRTSMGESAIFCENKHFFSSFMEHHQARIISGIQTSPHPININQISSEQAPTLNDDQNKISYLETPYFALKSCISATSEGELLRQLHLQHRGDFVLPLMSSLSIN